MENLKYKYLVIEDDTNIWSNIERRMQKFENWSPVGFCAEYSDSLMKIQNHRPHLVFSDWSIRGGNGFQILEFMKTMDNYHPYVVFFTGYQSDFPEIPQVLFNNHPMVKKYIVKPIFETLTKYLSNYIEEAETHHREHQKSCSIMLENEAKDQIKICPANIVAIIQSPENPRLKQLYVMNMGPIVLKKTWDSIFEVLHEYNIPYFVCHKRKTIINTIYISKTVRPFIWMENGLVVEVTRERWLT